MGIWQSGWLKDRNILLYLYIQDVQLFEEIVFKFCSFQIFQILQNDQKVCLVLENKETATIVNSNKLSKMSRKWPTHSLFIKENSSISNVQHFQ